MPYVMTHCWYPNHIADEVVRKYLEVMQKYPPDESIAKPIIPAAVAATKEGLEVLSVDEAERQKIGDALERNVVFMTEFRNITGFNYEIKTWATVEEALARIGLGA
jgi:hypothetical protein